MGRTAFATHCPLCGTELSVAADAYRTRVRCPEHGRIQVDVYRFGT